MSHFSTQAILARYRAQINQFKSIGALWLEMHYIIWWTIAHTMYHIAHMIEVCLSTSADEGDT